MESPAESTEHPELREAMAALAMEKPSKWMTNLLLMPLIALATAMFGCVSLLCSVWDRSGRKQHLVARAWARVLLRLSMSPVRVVGLEKLQGLSAAVYACNHLSYMDTPVLFAKLPFQFRILAKQSLWKVPFIGWHLHRSGQVPVDQSSRRSAIVSLSRGVAALNAGVPLLIFPEGGRSKEGVLQEFLSGGAYMAIKAQVPLVPLTLIGTYELLPIHVYHLAPQRLLLIIGDPILTSGLNVRDAEALTARVRETITQTYMAESTGTRSSSDSPASRGG